MPTEIKAKIVGFSVKKDEAEVEEKTVIKHVQAPLLTREEAMNGFTYKIKTPMIDHAFYITINNKVLNEGTDKERLVPYEVFINTKNMEHFMWITALTRVISAVFRKGDDSSFLVEELKAVFDPRGGYYKKGGLFVSSLVAEIGMVLETHLKKIGMIESEDVVIMTSEEKSEKLKEIKKDGIPTNATICNKCNQKAVVRLDNCQTCLECGDSKCG